jgi:putative hydrolase of the HAD superfamily
MSKIRSIVFGIDDVLFDAVRQTSNARLTAVRAMIDAGLSTNAEKAYKTLEGVVEQFGPDDTHHFDELLRRLGVKWNPRIVAAGVVAYRKTNPVYLKPYPDAVPTLLELRDLGFKIGCSSYGRSVKQWQKLIDLGLEHIFHDAVFADDLGMRTFNARVLRRAVKVLGHKPAQTLFVGAHPNIELRIANKIGVAFVRINEGGSKLESTRIKPKHEISRLSQILKLTEEL